MTTKRDMERSTRRVFGRSCEYREHGPDGIGWYHAQVDASLFQVNTQGRTLDDARSRMAAFFAALEASP